MTWYELPAKWRASVARAWSGVRRLVRFLPVWCRNIWRDLFGPQGYRIWLRVFAAVVAAYFGLYSVMAARHARLIEQALFERSEFITMASSGNRTDFIAALSRFGPVQTVFVPRAPSLLKPWRWLEMSQPNMQPLHRWARDRLSRCTAEQCGTDDGYRIDLLNGNLQGAKLKGTSLFKSRLLLSNLKHADLRGTILIGSNLRDADLRNADLREAELGSVSLNGADLRWSDLRGADIWKATLRDTDRTAELGEQAVTLEGRGAKLQGADLREVKNWTPDQLETAYWDVRTQWPCGYVPLCPVNLPTMPCRPD